MKTLEHLSKILKKSTALATILTLLCVSVVLAASGGLDTTFSGDGKLKINLVSGVSNSAVDVALQADGKIVAVGDVYRSDDNWDIGIARFKSGGGLDTTFNTTGKKVTDLGAVEQGMGIVIDKATGKIIVAGQKCPSADCDSAVLRYNKIGSLDTTFNAKGYRVDDFGGGDNGTFGAIALQKDGKIVIGGYMFNMTNNDYDFAIYRYTSKGSLDTTFNGTGKKAISFGSGRYDYIRGIAIQPSNGKIIVVGATCDSSEANCNFAIARLNSNGSLDTSFNSTGKVTTNFGAEEVAYDIALQPDGKIVVVGVKITSTTRFFALARYNSNGKPDTTFAGTGKKILDFSGSGQPNEAWSVEIQPADSKIVVCGNSNEDFALARLTTAGKLDTSFNGTGKVTIDFGGSDRCLGLAIQPADGKYVLVGRSLDTIKHWALARVLP